MIVISICDVMSVWSARSEISLSILSLGFSIVAAAGQRVRGSTSIYTWARGAISLNFKTTTESIRHEVNRLVLAG